MRYNLEIFIILSLSTKVEMSRKTSPINNDFKNRKDDYYIFVCEDCGTSLGINNFFQCEDGDQIFCRRCVKKCSKHGTCRTVWCKSHTGSRCLECGKNIDSCKMCSCEKNGLRGLCHSCYYDSADVCLLF